MNFKLSKSKIDALVSLVGYTLENHQPEDIQGQLVYELLFDIYKRLDLKLYKMRQKGATMTKMTLNSRDQKVFVLWWLSFKETDGAAEWAYEMSVVTVIAHQCLQANTGIKPPYLQN